MLLQSELIGTGLQPNQTANGLNLFCGDGLCPVIVLLTLAAAAELSTCNQLKWLQKSELPNPQLDNVDNVDIRHDEY